MRGKKLWLTIGCCLGLIVLACFGAYQYLLTRYSSQLDQVLEDLIADTAPTPANEQTPVVGGTPPQPPATTPQQPSAQSSGHAASPPAEEPPASNSNEPTPTDPAVADAATGLNLTEQEQAKAESVTDILEEMTMTEKLMVLKTLNRFSASELLQMYRTYSSGDAEAIAAMKEEIKAKFTEDDIDLIKQMVAKYR